MDDYNPIDSYPHSNNRLLVVDWASLSYHQLFALVSKQNTARTFEMDTPEKELYAWNTGMMLKMLKYVKLFNPKDIVFTLEGTKVWRNDICKDYYNEHCEIYYDKTGYYLRYDNFLYYATKDDITRDISYKKLDVIKDIGRLPSEHKNLGAMPDRIQQIFWDDILPKYKGNRAKNDNWPFLVPKKKWKNYKEEYAHSAAKTFRAHVIGQNNAEGDDVIYVAVNLWKKKYDSIILITGDSDMHQLLSQDNLEIYNHRKEEMVVCPSPADVLEIKILSGDKSDNINGMALPGKKLQLGPAGAQKLYESVGNTYQVAKDDGWDKQYIRNQTLIDLSHIPTDVQRELCDLFKASEPKIEPTPLNVTEKVFEEISTMKNLGFYAVNSLQMVEKNPDMFNPKMFGSKDKQPVAVAESRKFESADKVFVDPLADDGDIF
jgi:5'-3' exonuclease